jgi:hypothetical protein
MLISSQLIEANIMGAGLWVDGRTL